MKREKKELTPLGKAVKKKLLELNKTQRELAKEIGINEFFLANILRGRQPGYKYIPIIIEHLGIDTKEFNK